LIIAAIYPVLLWLVVFRFRRRLVGLVVLGAGTLVLWPLATIVTKLGAVGLSGGGGGMLVAKLMWAEMFLVVLIGGALWLVRRPPAHPYCAYCHYDLTGLDTSQVQVPCPECGECLSQGLRLAGGAIPKRNKASSQPLTMLAAEQPHEQPK
jgi:hypothetical protein